MSEEASDIQSMMKLVELEDQVTQLKLSMTNAIARITEAIDDLEGDSFDEGIETLKVLIDAKPPKED